MLLQKQPDSICASQAPGLFNIPGAKEYRGGGATHLDFFFRNLTRMARGDSRPPFRRHRDQKMVKLHKSTLARKLNGSN